MLSPEGRDGRVGVLQWQKGEQGIICGGRAGKEGRLSLNTKGLERKVRRVTLAEETTERSTDRDMRLEK